MSGVIHPPNRFGNKRIRHRVNDLTIRGPTRLSRSIPSADGVRDRGEPMDMNR